MNRREKLNRTLCLAFIVHETKEKFAAAEPVALPLEVARQLQVFMAAAGTLSDLLEHEVKVLDESPDEWGGSDGH